MLRAAPHPALTGLGLVVVAFAFFACGSGDSHSAPNHSAPSPTATSTPERARHEATTPTPDDSASRPIVVLDPGHGDDDIGAADHGVVEKESNLEMAFRVEALLEAAGVEVILTRREDVRVGGHDATGFARAREDRQARVDIANAAGADVFVSIHSNGVEFPEVRGVETYYNRERPFADRSFALATYVHRGVLAEAEANGYRLHDRGVREDECLNLFGEVCRPLFVLGPPRLPDALDVERGLAHAGATRATQMPGVLVELLYISNAEDARLLGDDEARQALARGVATGILRFLADEGLWPVAAD